MSRGLKSATACTGNKRIYKVVVDSKKPAIIAPAKPLVTADLPSAFNPPIDQDKLQAISASNPGFRDAIQGYTMKKLDSVTTMMIQANQGEPYAQLFYGLAHTETWTNIYDKKQACYWFRQSAVAGVSQARLFLATKAFKDKECFDVPPTLEQAKVWAQLASMSTDSFVKADAEKLLQEILKFQIERGGK
jgi:TPR repeat protein